MPAARHQTCNTTAEDDYFLKVVAPGYPRALDELLSGGDKIRKIASHEKALMAD